VFPKEANRLIVLSLSTGAGWSLWIEMFWLVDCRWSRWLTESGSATDTFFDAADVRLGDWFPLPLILAWSGIDPEIVSAFGG
jgi:hypothetical protein